MFRSCTSSTCPGRPCLGPCCFSDNLNNVFSIYAVQKRNTISNKLSIWEKVGSRYFRPSKLNPWETLVPNFHTTFSNIIATPSRNFQCLVSNVKPLMTASCSCFRLFPTGSSSLLLWEKQLHHQIRCGRRLYLVTCLSLSNNYKNHMQQKVHKAFMV